MLALIDPTRVHNLLCLGAHCDDIEIGCGGTVLRLLQANPAMRVRWVVFGAADSVRRDEAGRAAATLLVGARDSRVDLLDFRDAYMQFDGVRLKDQFELIKREFSPDLILTHHDDDRHQDHRTISQLTWNTWRNHPIFEYEIFKYDGDLSRPGVFVPLDREHCQKKVSTIIRSFESQRGKHWFTDDVFWSLMRLRGVECNSPSGFAEAFHARKLVVA